MRVVTDAEMHECLSHFTELRVEPKAVAFHNPQSKIINVDLRVAEPHQLLWLARLAASLTEPEKDFRGAYLWITQWGVWDPNVEAVGFNTLERYRQGFGENRSLTTAAGHVFRHDEFLSSVPCLVQPMLVGWDAYYIPHTAAGDFEYFLFVSHDSFLEIHTRTDKAHREANQRLEALSWVKRCVT